MWPIVNMYFNYVPRPVPEPTNLSERLATVLGGLRDIAALHAGRNWALIPVTLLFSAYLGSVIRRFTALAARLAAGPLRTRPPRSTPPNRTRERAPRKSRLPARFAWVVDWLGYHAAGRGSQLRYLLTEDAEMAALLAASPQGGRIFRPLCRMMGIAPAPDLPPSLFPPPAAKPEAPEPTPLDLPEISPPPPPSSQALSLRSRTKGTLSWPEKAALAPTEFLKPA